jgi:hypothetical protein
MPELMRKYNVDYRYRQDCCLLIVPSCLLLLTPSTTPLLLPTGHGHSLRRQQ